MRENNREREIRETDERERRLGNESPKSNVKIKRGKYIVGRGWAKC